VDLALGAVTVHLQLVSGHLKIVALTNLLLHIFDSFLCKLHHFSTIQTAKVAMVFMSIDVFIVQMTIFEIGLLNETTFK
jgi:hypothetical protein